MYRKAPLLPQEALYSVYKDLTCLSAFLSSISHSTSQPFPNIYPQFISVMFSTSFFTLVLLAIGVAVEAVPAP